MTKFVNAKFSVGGYVSPEYDKNYEETFGKRLRSGDCVACEGHGRVDGVECKACAGTGRSGPSKRPL